MEPDADRRPARLDPACCLDRGSQLVLWQRHFYGLKNLTGRSPYRNTDERVATRASTAKRKHGSVDAVEAPGHRHLVTQAKVGHAPSLPRLGAVEQGGEVGRQHRIESYREPPEQSSRPVESHQRDRVALLPQLVQLRWLVVSDGVS